LAQYTYYRFPGCRILTIARPAVPVILLSMSIDRQAGTLAFTRSAVWVAVVFCMSAYLAAGEPPDRVIPAAQRAIALLQESQQSSSQKQGCANCHHQYLPALAFQSAREHGVPFNEALAHADAARAFDFTNLDRAVQYTHVTLSA
jgi:cytochrome c553